ncbi:MAG: TIGR03617 family F420-dependent LLM class oxidoreductase [Alphaproteobacteria bacterium]|jgi:probable F420-dependent oxidoreductase|nr:TIGR03617 family F420-dependent LLM class oxidoreductase [Alphaproteobacteria bacterium]MDP6565552.1 TIGR03617 family F420-dependent LLM class oxidoreductase [Alphaproteobacteria bacterium]MDP6812091.1 TIGR03617 family F420-dependent LLM class oxidoreductase [Alphaproteobacteria bacterium]
MKIETLLPLGKTDPGLRATEMPLDLGRVGEDARLVEALGYDGLVVEETKDDPFVVMALAGQATTTLKLGTAVAIAFPRSPTTTALSAWSIQKLSKGRFTLGLGPQVRGHIQRRYGLKWSPPGPWMREYVQAMRAVWDCWQNGTPLDFEGQHYRLNLMVPLFNPGPIEHPSIPVHLAAVNRNMCRAAGAVADGLRPHPVCTPKYIREVMLPAAQDGAVAEGRALDDFVVAMKPLVATAPDADSLAGKVRDVRARVAFYASTPAYRPAFESHGLGDLAAELSSYSKAQRWEEMPGFITDEILHTYAVVGTYDEIGQRLLQRYQGVVDSIEFSTPARDAAEQGMLRDLVQQIQRDAA